MMKRGHFFPLFVLLLTATPAVMNAQANHSLTLDECYRLARQNYPLIKERELIASTRQFSVDNASKGYLPQFGVNGQLTYQSDVTGLPFKVPGFDIPTISKTQYKINGTVNQTIYDGGDIQIQKLRKGLDADIQDQSLEVQLYELKDRINQLYFGILLFTEQIKQNVLQQEDLKVAVQATQAAVDNGSGFRRALDESRVELLNAEQNNINLRATRKAYLDVLGLFLGQPLGETTLLETPPEISPNSSINRPELRVYDLQKSMYDLEQRQLTADLRPKFGAFVEGGYSLPGLNFLKTTPQWYYLGGLRLNWSLGSLYTVKNSRKILLNDSKTQDIQKETFVFNTNQTLRQQENDISKLHQLIDKDNAIIELRTSIKNAGKAQAQNGVITVHDYLIYVNDENRARQELVLHQVQLLLSQYSYKTTSGN